MATVKRVEVWVLVDGDGDYVVSEDASDLRQRYADVVGGDLDDVELPHRVFSVRVDVPLPGVPTLFGTVPDCGEVALQVG